MAASGWLPGSSWTPRQRQRAGIDGRLADSGNFADDSYLLLGAIFEHIKPGSLGGFVPYAQRSSLAGESAHRGNAELLLDKLNRQTAVPVCSAGDLLSGDANKILCLLWSLALFWHNPESSLTLSASSDSGLTKLALIVKQQLLRWCQDDVKEAFPTLSVSSFRVSFSDGSVLAALVHKRVPDVCTREQVLRCDAATLGSCLAAAQSKLGVPALLTADELMGKPDEQALIILLAYFRHLSPAATAASDSAATSAAATADGKRSSDLDSRLEQMRSRIRAKINDPQPTPAAPTPVASAAPAAAVVVAPLSSDASDSARQSRMLLERNQELEANIAQLQQQLAAVTAKAQEMERLARSVKSPTSGVDPSFDTTLAEIELALLEMIPEDQDTARLDEQLDKLRQAVAQVCRKAEERTPNNATTTTSSSASPAAAPVRVNIAAVSDLSGDDDPLTQLRTRLLDLERFHYLHHCSWRELCVATLLPHQ